MESKRRLNLVGLFGFSVCALTLVVNACNDGEKSSATEGGVMRGIDPFCNTRPKIEFCEDFDVDPLPGAFEAQIADSGTMVTIDDQSASLPNSLLIRVNSEKSAILQHTFDMGGKLRLFGMIYVPELGTGEVKIASFSLGDYHIGFGVYSDGTLWAFENDQRYMGSGSIPVGKWASFRWDVNRYDDGTGTAKLRFGNDFIIDTAELTTPLEMTQVPKVMIGLSEATGPWEAYFDNINVSVGEVIQ